MTTFKLVISDPKEKKAYQVEVDQKSSALVGKRIGDVFDGGIAGLSGYKLQVTGGSDKQGFPMRGDVEGQARKKILLAFGPGFHPRMRGQRKRKSVRGNTISLEIVQVNAKISEYGKEPVAKLIGKGTPKEGKEEKPAEGKEKPTEKEEKEKPKEAVGKPEEKKEAPKKEKPAEPEEKEEKPAEKPEEKKKESEKPSEKKPEEAKEPVKAEKPAETAKEKEAKEGKPAEGKEGKPEKGSEEKK